MAFCTNCGQKIEVGANFCSGCGVPIGGSGASCRKQVFEGDIHKCPNCGEVINAFDTKCPSCGFEFRDAQASSAVREFARQLQEIESKRKNKSALSGVAEAFGIKRSDSTDEQKISLIRNFSVPNTKEDVLEFMILASSNIDPSLYSNSNNSTEKSVSDAWIAKTGQVYQKAKLAFGSDPDFAEIKSMYDGKMGEIRKNKRQPGIVLAGLLLFLVFDLGILFFMAGRESKEKEKLETQLNAIVSEIQADIINGDYDVALIKANGLRFDKSLDSKKAEQWDEQRENLIELIKEKREDN